MKQNEDIKSITENAEKGDAVAQYQLGCTFLENESPELDKAKYWFELSAKQGCPEGLNGLGYCHLVLKQHEDALTLFKEAADMGPAKSKHNLAYLYERGLGVEQDDAKSFSLYLCAAEDGYVPSMVNVGYCYAQGRGTPRNEAKSFYWMTKAAKNQDREALYNVARYYNEGIGVWKNVAVAKAVLQHLSDCGYEDATRYLECLPEKKYGA